MSSDGVDKFSRRRSDSANGPGPSGYLSPAGIANGLGDDTSRASFIHQLDPTSEREKKVLGYQKPLYTI